MPITRLQARAKQTLDRVAPTGDGENPSSASVLNLTNSRQPNVLPAKRVGCVSRRPRESGGRPSIILAVGIERHTKSNKCNDARCLTCPDLIFENEFVCNSTGRRYSVVNPSARSIHCKMQNYVYLLTCKSCNVQYVGESITPLHKRINVHRRGKSGCEISIDHYSNVCCNDSFLLYK